MSGQVAEVSLLGKIAGYTEILSKDPRSTVFVPLSEAYRKMKMLDDAIDVASKGVAALPNYAPGYIALARAQAEHGQVAAAAASFEHVLRLEEENVQGLKGLARVRMMQSRIDDARKLLEKAKRLAPDDPQIDGMLRSLNQGVAQAPAVVEVERGAEVEAPIATATLAEIYVRQGLHRKAFNIYRELYQADPNNRALSARLNELKVLLAPEADRVVDLQGVGEGAVVAPLHTVQVAATSSEATTTAGYSDAVVRLNRWLELIRRRRQDVR